MSRRVSSGTLAVSVRLEYQGRLTCTYPAPDPDGAWRVTARPDGTLTDKQGREYSYLFWEGASDGTHQIGRAHV